MVIQIQDLIGLPGGAEFVNHITLRNNILHDSYNNDIWSDPTGTMGAENPSRPNDFSDTPVGETSFFTLDNNLYWNGGASIPTDSGELVNYTDDANRIVADPLLSGQAGIDLPRWQSDFGDFVDGSTSIRQTFERLVSLYGKPAKKKCMPRYGRRRSSSR